MERTDALLGTKEAVRADPLNEEYETLDRVHKARVDAVIAEPSASDSGRTRPMEAAIITPTVMPAATPGHRRCQWLRQIHCRALMSMRAISTQLAKHLGVTRQTLYRHLGPKGELRPDGERVLAK